MTTRTVPLVVLAAAALTSVSFGADELHPVVDFRAGYLLGSSTQGNTWLLTKSLAKSNRLPGQKKYRVYSAIRYLGETSGAKAASSGAPCPDTQFVEFSPSSQATQYKAGEIAIAGAWNALPRVARSENLGQQVYREAVAKVLTSKGIAKPVVRIAQVMRVDLEGDGVSEVLINATNHQGGNGLSGSVSPNSKAGEYSMILLRKIVNGKVQTTLVEGDFYPKAKTFNAPGVYRIAGAFDVNGDGKMEIVTKGRYYEGDWTTVYSVSGGKSSSVLKVSNVLGDGCGA